MYPFWTPIVEPLLLRHKPRVIVEIGSEAGHNLKLLLKFAESHPATIHAIDPKPLFNVDDWTRQCAGRLVVHREASLTAIPRLPAFDTLFIDGDHNWYTVFHELKAVEHHAAALSIPFPLVLLHDIGWPWGRRDLYYDPASIPAEFRQPYNEPAAKPGTAAYHADFCRAQQEGGPRNGVLTAVEDFLAQTTLALELIHVPGFAGLGILFPRALREGNRELSAFLDELKVSPSIRKHIELLEFYRMRRTK